MTKKIDFNEVITNSINQNKYGNIWCIMGRDETLRTLDFSLDFDPPYLVSNKEMNVKQLKIGYLKEGNIIYPTIHDFLFMDKSKPIMDGEYPAPLAMRWVRLVNL